MGGDGKGKHEGGPTRGSTPGQPREKTVAIDSGNLLAGHKEIQIRHAGEVYRLRLTKNGKLILNK